MQQKVADTVRVELILEVYGGCIALVKAGDRSGSARLVQPITFHLLGWAVDHRRKSGLSGS